VLVSVVNVRIVPAVCGNFFHFYGAFHSTSTVTDIFSNTMFLRFVSQLHDCQPKW
jgi:hypothetical protein